MQAECDQRHMPYSPVEIYQGDMLKFDWSDADIIYLSSVVFPEELIEGLADLFKQVKKGTRIMSLKEFPERSFLTLYATIKVKMNWGI